MNTPDFLASLTRLPVALQIAQIEGAEMGQRADPIWTEDDMRLLRTARLELQRRTK